MLNTMVFEDKANLDFSLFLPVSFYYIISMKL